MRASRAAAIGRFVPILLPGDDFFERNDAKPCSPFNMAPMPLAKPPVSLSLGGEGPVWAPARRLTGQFASQGWRGGGGQAAQYRTRTSCDRLGRVMLHLVETNRAYDPKTIAVMTAAFAGSVNPYRIG
jgi:hypothetical protein